MFRRRKPEPPKRPSPVIFFEDVCKNFKIPVTYVPLRIARFDGIEMPWAYRAVNN